jgi:hypothetical protein
MRNVGNPGHKAMGDSVLCDEIIIAVPHYEFFSILGERLVRGGLIRPVIDYCELWKGYAAWSEK